MSKTEDISTIEKILERELRSRELSVSIQSIEKKAFRSPPSPPIRKKADKKPYPTVVMTIGMKRRAKILPVPILIAVVFLVVFVLSHIIISTSGNRSVGQFIYFHSLALTTLMVLFIYAVALGLGVVAYVIARSILSGKYLQNVRKSKEYREQCTAIDELNRAAQQKLDELYSKELNYYNNTILKEYNLEKEAWLKNKETKISTLKAEKASIHNELRVLYAKSSLIPSAYRNPSDLSQILQIMKRLDMSIEQAVEHYSGTTRQRSWYDSQRRQSNYQSKNNEKNYFEGCNNWKAINKRWRELMKMYHPDKGGSLEISQSINSQYEKLKKMYGK